MSIEALKLIERIAERVERIELRQTKIEENRTGTFAVPAPSLVKSFKP